MKDNRDVLIEQIVTKSIIDNKSVLQLKARNLGINHINSKFSLYVFVGSPAKNTKCYQINTPNILEDFLNYSEWFTPYVNGFNFVNSYYENDYQPNLPNKRQSPINLSTPIQAQKKP